MNSHQSRRIRHEPTTAQAIASSTARSAAVGIPAHADGHHRTRRRTSVAGVLTHLQTGLLEGKKVASLAAEEPPRA